MQSDGIALIVSKCLLKRPLCMADYIDRKVFRNTLLGAAR